MRFRFRLLLLPLLFSVASAHAAPLTLAEAETRLLQSNHAVLAARRALEGATADITTAGQAPNPTLSYSATDYSPRSGVGRGSLGDKRLDQTVLIQQQFERGNRRELRRTGAEALAQAAEADYADTRRQQRLALHQAWFDWLAATEKKRLLSETAELYKRGMVATDLRLRLGDVSRVEAGRLRIEALRAENEARGATADYDKTRNEVAFLIGEADTRQLEPALIWPPLQPADMAGTDLRRDERPDVRAANSRMQASERRRELARSLTTRDITLGAQVERDPATIAGVTYGLTVSVPLFVRYGYEGEKARAESDYYAAQEEGERIRQRVSVEIGRARADLAAATEKLQRIESETLPQAREVGAATEFAYRKGALNLNDLLDARRILRAVELEAVAARADHAKARAAWLAATEWELARQ
ncbi:MAG: TolC family protein [Rhodocyclaceae bacterium]|nr:TolC family protein [Rhodocyclaceae bacterium]